MRKVYWQPYTKRREISAWIGTPPKGHFKYDLIKVRLSDQGDIWVTPDEAADIIRALSAALHHWLVKGEVTPKRIVRAKKLADLRET